MRSKRLAGALGLALMVAVAGGAYAEQVAQAPADPIAARKDNRKQAGGEMRAIKAIIDKGGPAAEAQPHVAKLKQLQEAHLKFYPAGSDKGETKAMAVVWSDWAGFQAANKAADEAIDKLAVAVGSGDMKQIADAYGAAGKACGACHDKFRAK